MTEPRNRLAEAFIRGFEAGSERPEDAGDGDAMYQAFRDWQDFEYPPDPRCKHEFPLPSWVGPDQADPCRCDLPTGHDGPHLCDHLRESG